MKVASIIDQAPISALQRTVFCLCILTSVLDGFDTQVLAFVAPEIARSFGISKLQLGIVFSAALLGSAIGSSLFGSLADRVGRRKLMIAMTALFGLLTGACALAPNFGALIILRLIGGIGLGGIMPNMLALTAEYAPARRRATLTTLTLWGLPAGAVLGGLISGPLIAAFGWRSVFVVGGAAPLLLVVAMLVLLPESLQFLACDATRRVKALALLRRIDPTVASDEHFEAEPINGRGQIGALFRPGMAAITALISLVMFLSLFLSYMLLNWMPTILASAGLPLSRAILGAAAINFGGIVGSYIISRAIDGRVRPLLVLAAGYSAAAIFMLLIGQKMGSANLPVILLLITGCGMWLIGSQISTAAYSATLYPVLLRGTGIGFVQSVSRIGSLLGPLIGGALLTAGFQARGIFTLATIPAVLAALTLIVLATLRPDVGGGRRHAAQAA